jgi:hypothetical protein
MATLQRRTKEIGEYSFEVNQLPYRAAQRLAVQLLAMLGAPLLSVIQLAGAGAGAAALAALANTEVDKLVPILSNAFGALDPDKAEALSAAILEGTRVQYKSKWVPLWDYIDAVLGGDFYVGLAVQAFALSVHFGNFSSARGAFEALGLKRKASNSEASTTSTDGKDAPLSPPAG